MDSEKKVRISADSSEIESTFARIKRIAEETSEAMMADVAKRSASSKELLRNLEDEIKLMERQQEMATLERRTGVQDRLSIDPNDKNAQRDLAEIKIDDKEAKIHTEILRDIVDAILATSRAEVDQDKKAVQESISKTPHDVRTFKQRYQAGLLGMGGDNLSEEDKGGNRFAGMARGYGLTAINARNPIEGGLSMVGETGGMMSAMGGAAAGAGIAMVLGAALGKKILDVSMQYLKQTGMAYATTGQDFDLSTAKLASRFGVSAIEYSGMLRPLARARRSGFGVQQSAMDQIMLEKGMGLDIGTYQSMDMLGLLEGRSGMGNVQSGIAALQAGGIGRGGDMSAVPDYLAIMVTLGKEQVSRLGKVDMGINTRMVAALGNMDETLRKSPEALSTMVNAVRGGLTGGNAQQQALQYSVLSKIAPGKSMFEYMEMREDPFSEKSKKYMPAYLGQLKKLSGGNDDRFFMEISQAFGLTNAMSRTLGTGFNKGKISEVLEQDFKNKEGLSDVEKRAEKAVPWQEKANADVVNTLITVVDILGKMGSDVTAARIKVDQIAASTAKEGWLDKILVNIWQQDVQKSLRGGPF